MQIRKCANERKSALAEVVGTLLRNERAAEARAAAESRATTEARFERVGVALINARNMRSRLIAAETVAPLAAHFDLVFEYHVLSSDYHAEGYLRRFEVLAGVSNWTMEYMRVFLFYFVCFGARRPSPLAKLAVCRMLTNWFLETWLTHREKLENKPSRRTLRAHTSSSFVEKDGRFCFVFRFDQSSALS